MEKALFSGSYLKGKTVRKLSSFINKVGDDEIDHFVAVLGALMRQVPCPKEARLSYLTEVEKRLRNEGGAFLALSRGFPTAGLKLLGNDLTGFPLKGFKKQPGEVYPRLFAWFWSELKRLSSVSNPTKADVLRVRRCLTVLSFARMIRCSSVRQIQRSVEGFENRVTARKPTSFFGIPGGSSPPDQGPELPSLWKTLGLSKKDTLMDKPRYVDLTSLSFKASALRGDVRFPKWFRDKFTQPVPKPSPTPSGLGLGLGNKSSRLGLAGGGLPAPSVGFREGPFGTLHAITERGGKIRTILPYNTPFVHSTGLFSRCRAILDSIVGDFSDNQAAGHRFVKRESSKGMTMVSADLSNMTDDILPDKLTFLFLSLNLGKIDRLLFNLPVCLPNGKVIVPSVLLMGLRGCFEAASVLHNYFVRLAGIVSYAMCGDDLFFVGELAPYEDVLKHFGPSLNRSKTVVSRTVAVFCGEYFWMGKTVSPVCPNISGIYHSGGYASCTQVFASTRALSSALDGLYDQKGIRLIMRGHRRALSRVWKGQVFDSLPQKMRGMGMKRNTPGGLARVLEGRGARECALKSIGISRKRSETQRWLGLPVELSSDPVLVLDFFHTLTTSGGISLTLPRVAPAPRKNVSKLNTYNALEWYYNDVRLEASAFQVDGI